MIPPQPLSRLGDRLVESGAVRRADVEAAAEEAARRHVRIGEVLAEMQHAGEAQIYRQLAAQRKLSFATAEELLALADPKVSAKIPPKFLEHHRVLVVAREGKKRVVVATCDPDAHVP